MNDLILIVSALIIINVIVTSVFYICLINKYKTKELVIDNDYKIESSYGLLNKELVRMSTSEKLNFHDKYLSFPYFETDIKIQQEEKAYFYIADMLGMRVEDLPSCIMFNYGDDLRFTRTINRGVSLLC